MSSSPATPVLRPFTIGTPDRDLVDLRERLANTRWPDAEPVQDWSQGVPLAYLQDLCRYWRDTYDWRATETRLNRLDQFLTTIDGVDIHLLHHGHRTRTRCPWC